MDTGLFDAINGLAGRADGVDDTVELISRYGPLVLVGALVLLWFWPGARVDRDRRQWGVIVATVGAALALGINQVIIRLWDRPRPFIAHHATLLLAPSHDPSFPSDHATFGFAVAVAIAVVARRAGLAALLLAALLAFSRVYAGEHYVSDVLAGAVVGSITSLAIYRVRPLLAPVIEPPLQVARRFHLA